MKKVILRLGTRIVTFNMRTIGIIILSLSPIFLGILCEPDYHRGEWYVKNYTDQTLTISFPPHYWKNKDVVSGDSVLIQMFKFTEKAKTIPYFDLFPRTMVSYGYNTVKIVSKDSILLKTWNYSDRDLPDKQFFKESSWRYYKNPKASMDAIWVFDIMPEDIIKKDD